uniref:Uncharacterized protein n=1 Tax=Aegilops tauschii TaxID=37682 RepID=M8AK81_AEGTA
MTSPASTSSWFSGIVRTASGNPPSSAMPPAGGVTSAPVSLPDTPAAVSGKGGVVAPVATTGVGARRKQLQGTLFKYGPKSAQGCWIQFRSSAACFAIPLAWEFFGSDVLDASRMRLCDNFTSLFQVAFRTGDFTRQVIFIGGLADGLLATE